MRALAYTRVSTQEQADEGYSLDAQRERIAAFCVSQGWPVAEWYTDDGYSAKNMDRPALQRMISDLQPGDIVVVYRLDRLTRSVFDLLTMLRLFEQRQVGFRSVTEVYDTTTAMGRLFVTIVAALAQWERENLAERVVMGMAQAATTAKWLGGNAPYGYRLVDGALVPDPVQAPVVQRMFRDYLGGAGVRAIAAALNAEGIPGPGGGHWHDQTVSLILRNPVYRGALSWGRRRGQGGQGRQDDARAITVEDVHPALVSPDVWHQAQAVKRRRSELPARTAASAHPLTGVLVCGLCGANVSGHTQRRYDQAKRPRWMVRHYRCQARIHRGTCSLPFIRADQLEEMVIGHLRQLASPGELARRLEGLLAAGRGGTGTELIALRDRRRRLDADMARLDRDYRSGELGARAYSRQLDALAEEHERIQARIRELESKQATPIDPVAEAARYAQLANAWPDLTMTERREAIRSVIRQVRVRPGPEIEVVYAWEPA